MNAIAQAVAEEQKCENGHARINKYAPCSECRKQLPSKQESKVERTASKLETMVLAVLKTEKKYITRLKYKEYLTLKESGKVNIEWAYDRIHSIITIKK